MNDFGQYEIGDDNTALDISALAFEFVKYLAFVGICPKGNKTVRIDGFLPFFLEESYETGSFRSRGKGGGGGEVEIFTLRAGRYEVWHKDTILSFRGEGKQSLVGIYR